MELYKFFDEGFDDMKKNSPLILTGLACVGVVATSVISIFAGKKLQKKDEIVKQKIEEKKSEGIVLTKKETVILHVKEKWPALAPVAVGVIVTGACVIGSYKISAKRIAALTTALTVTTKAFDGYKAAAEKLLGEKEKEIQREKMKNDILENPPKKEDEQKFNEQKKMEYENNVFNGVNAFWEPLTKQCIYCTESDVVRALEEINYRVKSGDEEFVPVGEFLYALSRYAQNQIKCNEKEVPEAYKVGWSYDRCKYGHGIEYNHKFEDGVRVGTQFYAKIEYVAYWDTGEKLDYIYDCA